MQGQAGPQTLLEPCLARPWGLEVQVWAWCPWGAWGTDSNHRDGVGPSCLLPPASLELGPSGATPHSQGHLVQQGPLHLHFLRPRTYVRLSLPRVRGAPSSPALTAPGVSRVLFLPTSQKLFFLNCHPGVTQAKFTRSTPGLKSADSSGPHTVMLPWVPAHFAFGALVAQPLPCPVQYPLPGLAHISLGGSPTLPAS